MEIKEIPIGQIRRDLKQPRKYFNESSIAEMALSIKTEGVINPIEIDKDKVIITGEMRWRSAKAAGLKTIPCKIISVSESARYRRQVIENVHHNTMTEWDTAVAVKTLLDSGRASIRSSKQKKGGLPDKGIHELSRLIGKSEKFIIEKLELLKASPQFQKAVQGGLSASYLRVLKRIPEEHKEVMEKKILGGEFKTRDSAQLVASAIRLNPDKAEELLNTNYSKVEVQAMPKAIKEIIPDFSETPVTKALEDALRPAEELMKAVNQLQKLLETYDLSDIGSLNLPRLVLGLKILNKKMVLWLTQVPEKYLSSGK